MAALNVLLVDDDQSLATTLSHGLRKAMGERVSVVFCANGAEALALLGSQAFHVLISDYHMPGMSGLEMLKRVRLDHAEMRLALITAFATEVLAQETRQLGIGYITKPFDLPVLVQWVQGQEKPAEPENTPPLSQAIPWPDEGEPGLA